MIDQREGPALLEIEMFAVVRLANRQQARLAQHAVRIADMIDRRDRVFAGDEPEQSLVVGFGHARGQPADHFVQLGHGRIGGHAVRARSAARRNRGAADRCRRSRAATAGRPSRPNRRSMPST